MVAERLTRWARTAAQSRSGRLLLKLFLIAPGSPAVLMLVARKLDPLICRQAIGKAMDLLGPEQRRGLVERFRRMAHRGKDIGAIELYWLAAAQAASVSLRAYELLEAPPLELATELRANSNMLIARAVAAYDLGRYKDAIVAFSAISKLDPRDLITGHNYLKAAHAAGLVCRKPLAMEFFARQFYFTDASYEAEAARFDRWIFHDLLTTAFEELQKEIYKGKAKRIGVFTLSSTEALGHAILDPYYFLALHRDRFDAVIFVGPSRDGYRPASRACLEVVEQYGHYVETGSDVLLNLSWMSIGTFKLGPLDLTFERYANAPTASGRWYLNETRQLGAVEFVIENYWSLLREAMHRTRDAADSFNHNAWHMKVPERFDLIGEAFCERHGIDLAKPLVVLHARAENYHGLAKQSFRNASIENYIMAVRHLIDSGYQVIRIGDRGMPPLKIDRPGYYELPFLDGYQTTLDPFLISRAAFMIGCQSGPCAYARALGVPLLSVNAVLHYTLLPGKMEMACFKQYLRTDGLVPEVMSLEDALAAGVYHFEGGTQFKRAGIRLEQATSDEILASVKDMIAWLEQPDLQESDLQLRFRAAVEQTTQDLMQRGDDLDLPVGDYLGIALPGYRISPSVAAMREREVTHASGGTSAI